MKKLIKHFLSNHANLVYEALAAYQQAKKVVKHNAIANHKMIYGADEVAEELEKILQPLLDAENLLDEKIFKKLQSNITTWYPNNLPSEDLYGCGLVQQVLEGMLPKQYEQRKRRLLHACQDYQTHLEHVIKHELKNNNAEGKLKILDKKNINEFVNSPDKQIVQIKENNKNLHLTIEKYKALYDIQSSLMTDENANTQLQNFKKKLNLHRSAIEKRRDSASMLFLKVATTILSFGIVALFGIWKIKGKATINKLESIGCDHSSRSIAIN